MVRYKGKPCTDIIEVYELNRAQLITGGVQSPEAGQVRLAKSVVSEANPYAIEERCTSEKNINCTTDR